MARTPIYTPASDNIPVVFQEDFVNTRITATQAWSLFFTGGKDEDKLGEKRMVGWLWNYFLFGIVVGSALEIAFFGGF